MGRKRDCGLTNSPPPLSPDSKYLIRNIDLSVYLYTAIYMFVSGIKTSDTEGSTKELR